MIIVYRLNIVWLWALSLGAVTAHDAVSIWTVGKYKLCYEVMKLHDTDEGKSDKYTYS